MATYNINDLTVRDGKLYAGNAVVGINDVVGSYVDTPIKPLFGSGVDEMGNNLMGTESTLRGQVPIWALTKDRLQSIAPGMNISPEISSWLDAAQNDPESQAKRFYTDANTDPVLRFANTGNNRQYLYGAYGSGGNNLGIVAPDPGEAGPGFMNSNLGPQFAIGAPQIGSSGSFARHMGIPDLATNWTGEEYYPSDELVGPISQKSAETAQAILKRLYPNVSQDDMDKAAYAAYRKGDKYYAGTGAPSENNSESYYYGHGPMPVVTAIAKQLGMTPEIDKFIMDNWSKTADQFAAARSNVKEQLRAQDSNGLGVVGGLIGAGIGFATGMPWLGSLAGGILSDGELSFSDLLGAGFSAMGGIGGLFGGAAEGAAGTVDAINSFDSGAMASALNGGTSGFNWNSVLTNAGNGAIRGLINNGTEGILPGAVAGGVSSAASNAATSAGASPFFAGAAGSLAGGVTSNLINSSLQPDVPGNFHTPNTPAAATAPARPAPGNNGLDWGGFSELLNTGNGNAYGRPEWGERLNNGRAA